MVNKRQPRRKRRNTRKSRGPTTKQLAIRIKKLEHTDELKYIHFNDTTAVSTSGIALGLSVLAQGDDFDQRIGEEVTAKYMNMKLRYTMSPSSGTSQIRIIVFWDMQTSGLGPDLLTAAGTLNATALLDNNTTTNSVMSPHNYRTKKRYKILMDRVFTKQPDDVLAEQILMINRNFKLGGAKIKYASSGSNTAAIVSRSLWVAVFGNTTAASVAASQQTFRVWFTDN